MGLLLTASCVPTLRMGTRATQTSTRSSTLRGIGRTATAKTQVQEAVTTRQSHATSRCCDGNGRWLESVLMYRLGTSTIGWLARVTYSRSQQRFVAADACAVFTTWWIRLWPSRDG